MDNNELSDENAALCTDIVRNFSYLKNSWPQIGFREHSISADIPIPNAELRERVRGAAAEKQDPTGEASNSRWRAYIILYPPHLQCLQPGRKFEKSTIFDWGCGCGRIIRFLPRSVKATGADVDPKGLEWCRNHLSQFDFLQLCPSQSIPAQDSSFDVIYSYSVLTHLEQDEQFFWLKELNRISRGILILSVYGPYSASKFGGWAQDPVQLRGWLRSGFKQSGLPNPNIADIVPEGYYTDVAHTPAYVYEQWNMFVNVIDVIPGGFGQAHDAVICSKRTL